MRVQQETPRWRRRRRRRMGMGVPWVPQMTQGPTPRGIRGPSPPNHYQPSVYFHDRAITTIGNSLSASAITVHSSALTKLWDSSHQSEFSNRHKITIIDHQTTINPPSPPFANSLSSLCHNWSFVNDQTVGLQTKTQI